MHCVKCGRDLQGRNKKHYGMVWSLDLREVKNLEMFKEIYPEFKKVAQHRVYTISVCILCFLKGFGVAILSKAVDRKERK